MSTSYKYFKFPFGVDGDLIPIPDPSGGPAVNYQNGWTPFYALELGVNPSALAMPRGSMNQLFNDITSTLQQYQQRGIPFFITSVQNGGTPFPYSKNALALYDPGSGLQAYISLADTNIALPTDVTKWQPCTFTGAPIGSFLFHGGVMAPINYVPCDAAPLSRTTYAALMAAITFSQSGVLNSSTTITGLSSTATMYVGMFIEGTGIPSNTTVASIVSGTSITISNAATLSATETLTFFSWGNGNGSTTFNAPDLRHMNLIGAGGTPAAQSLFQGTVVGASGGAEVHTQDPTEIAGHAHGAGGIQVIIPIFPGGAGNNEVAQTGGGSPGIPVTLTASGSTASFGSSVPFNITQLGRVALMCIKYQ